MKKKHDGRVFITVLLVLEIIFPKLQEKGWILWSCCTHTLLQQSIKTFTVVYIPVKSHPKLPKIALPQ